MPQSRWKKNILAWVRRRKEKSEVLMKGRPGKWYTSFLYSVGSYHACIRIEQLLRKKSDMRELSNDICSMYVAWCTRDIHARNWSENRDAFPSLRILTHVRTPGGVEQTVMRDYPSNLEIENRRKLEEVASYYNGMYSLLREFYYQFIESGLKTGEMTGADRTRMDSNINGGMRGDRSGIMHDVVGHS
jgi:hypothetical protein